MAREVRVPVEAFERGRLPAICCLSGVDTEDRINVTAETESRLGWLIVFGIVPWVVGRAATKKAARGVLPLSEDVYRTIVRRRSACRPVAYVGCGAVVGGLLVAGAAAAAGFVLLLVGLLTVAVGFTLLKLRDPTSAVHLDAEGRWVHVPAASDRFADAVDVELRAGRM